jgi:hypothetical protein
VNVTDTLKGRIHLEDLGVDGAMVSIKRILKESDGWGVTSMYLAPDTVQLLAATTAPPESI